LSGVVKKPQISGKRKRNERESSPLLLISLGQINAVAKRRLKERVPEGEKEYRTKKCREKEKKSTSIRRMRRLGA